MLASKLHLKNLTTNLPLSDLRMIPRQTIVPEPIASSPNPTLIHAKISMFSPPARLLIPFAMRSKLFVRRYAYIVFLLLISFVSRERRERCFKTCFIKTPLARNRAP